MSKLLHFSWRRTLGICAAIILIVIIATAAYRASNDAPMVTRASTALSTPFSIQTIISALNAKLSADYAFLRQTTPTAQTTVGYEFPGDNFEVILPTTSPSIAYSDASTTSEQTTYTDLSKAAAFMRGYLPSHGFSVVPDNDQTEGLLSAVYFYKRVDAICQISVSANLSATCSPIAQLEATAKQAGSLVAAYNTAAPNSGTAIVAAPTIRPSKTVGYTIATLPIYNNRGETSANFYRQGNNAWQIVNLGWYNDPHEDADIIPNCADFESYTPVREAFAGQICYDSAIRATRSIRG